MCVSGAQKSEKKPPDKEKSDKTDKPKRLRPDVATRLASNKETSVTVVPTTLNSFLLSEEIKGLVKGPLENMLFQSNKAAFEAYNLANLHAVRMLSIGKSIDPTQDYYYKCLSAVCSTELKNQVLDNEFKTSIELYIGQRPDRYVVPNSLYLASGVFQNLSLQMKTNAYNFIEMRFYRIFLKYLKHKYKLDGKVAYTMLEQIQNESYDGLDDMVMFYRSKMYEIAVNLGLLVKKEVVPEEAKIRFNKRLLLLELLQRIPKTKEVKIKKSRKSKEPKKSPEEKQRDKEEKKLIQEEEKKKKKQLRSEANEQRKKELEKNGIQNIELTMTELFKMPYSVLPFLYEILDYNEKSQLVLNEDNLIDKGIRLFNILPTKNGFGISNIKICNNGIYGLIKHVELIHPDEMKELLEKVGVTIVSKPTKEQIRSYWRLFFNISKFEKNGKIFDEEIMTNGKSVSITMRKRVPSKKILDKYKTSEQKKLGKSEEIRGMYSKLDRKDFDEILGGDPGRTYTIVTTNEKGETIRLSTKSYYDDSKFRESNRIIETWKNKYDYIRDSITRMPTSKSASVETLCNYIKYSLSKLNILLNFNREKKFRDLKMKRFIFSKKTLSKMCKIITKNNPRTLIGFGDYSNNDSSDLIKNCQIGPVNKLKKELQNFCTVVPVDEFRTSKLHNKCGCELVNAYMLKKDKDGLERNCKVHSVLYCNNNSCKGTTMNRDNNASKNILDILLYEIEHHVRHPDFLRSRVLAKNSHLIPSTGGHLIARTEIIGALLCESNSGT
jgi:hypothetical protein